MRARFESRRRTASAELCAVTRVSLTRRHKLHTAHKEQGKKKERKRILDGGQIAPERGAKGVEEKAVKYSRKTSFIWKQTFQTEAPPKKCLRLLRLRRMEDSGILVSSSGVILLHILEGYTAIASALCTCC